MNRLFRMLANLGLLGQLVRRADQARDHEEYARAAKFYSLALILDPERGLGTGILAISETNRPAELHEAST